MNQKPNADRVSELEAAIRSYPCAYLHCKPGKSCFVHKIIGGIARPKEDTCGGSSQSQPDSVSSTKSGTPSVDAQNAEPEEPSAMTTAPRDGMDELHQALRIVVSNMSVMSNRQSQSAAEVVRRWACDHGFKDDALFWIANYAEGATPSEPQSNPECPHQAHITTITAHNGEIVRYCHTCGALEDDGVWLRCAYDALGRLRKALSLKRRDVEEAAKFWTNGLEEARKRLTDVVESHLSLDARDRQALAAILVSISPVREE